MNHNEARAAFRRIGLSVALLTIVLAMAFGVFAGGQLLSTAEAQQATPEQSTSTSLPRTITVVGEGTVRIEPDVAEASIGVEVMGDAVKDASADAEATMNAVIAALRKQGIASKDIQTSSYSIWTERSYGSELRADSPVIYRVNNSVTVKIRDLTAVGDVLDAVIEAGANNINGVTFGVADPAPLAAEARRLAAENARTRAEELAALHGVTVGEVVSISEVMGGGVLPNFQRAAAESVALGGPVAPGELELTAQLQVIYAIGGPAEAKAVVTSTK